VVLCSILAAACFCCGIFFFLGDWGNAHPSSTQNPTANSSALNSDLARDLPESEACDLHSNLKGKPVEISDMTSDGDTLLSLFSLSFCDATSVKRAAESLASTIQADLGKRFLPTDEIPPGKRFSIHLDEKGEFQKATIEFDPSRLFHCEKTNETVKSWKENVVLDYKIEVISFNVQRDVTESLLAIREQRELALKLMHVFRWDIDFQGDPRKGDACKIVFERRYADDRPTGYGRILFAVYEGKRTGRKTACLFNGQYFDENGVELKRDYLRTPLNTLRITSGYGWRIHPVLNRWKFHTGVDYGAPTGTPVYAIADGTVTFQGSGEAYGLYVCVRHSNGYESRYSHLSRISVKTGQKVKQRQTVGLVGSTGRSTGPHLFFEILDNGKRLDPTKIKLIKNPRTVPAPLHDRFKSVIRTQHQVITQTVSPSGRRT